MNHDIVSIRQQFPAVLTQAYLNTGSAGPLSRPAAEAIAAWNQRQLNEGRGGGALWAELRPVQENLRAQFARLLGAGADEIALTHHTTDGMNIATWGIPWQPGDEIVTTSHEHPGGLLPVYAVARRFGLTVRVVRVALDDDHLDLIDKFRAAINDRTRLVSLSHVSWKTGTVFPLAEVARAAHQHGALVAVDGAQSGGAIGIDVKKLDVDFYAIPGQKWLCGPEGTGALYVRRERLADLRQTYVGFPSMRDGRAQDFEGNFLVAEGARRYEIGTVYWPGLAGISASLSFYEELGYEWITHQVQRLTRTCREQLEAVPGVNILSPKQHAGLTSFTVEGVNPDEAVAGLAAHNVTIRSIHDPDLLRVSTSFYNDESDIQRLCDGLARLRS